MLRNRRSHESRQASLPTGNKSNREVIDSSGLRVAFDMTFPNRNQAGSGVYARALIAALSKTGELRVEQIAASESGGSLGTLRWLAIDAQRILAGRNVDLLHCPAYVAPLRSPCPVVITIHDAATHRFPADYPLGWRLFSRFLIPRLVRRASAVIAPSEFARREAATFYGVQMKRVVVTHEAAEHNYVPQPPDKTRLYRQRFDGSSPLILFVGAPIARKNLDIVLRVLRDADEQSALASAQVLIVGAKHQDFPTYRRWTLDNRLEDRVRWLGRVPDEEMPLLYGAADLLVYPSLYEGFGLPPLEAMAVGTPVVASKATCLPEILGDAALLVHPRDVAGFSQAIEAVLTRPELRAALVQAGKRQAEKYSWERCARETTEVYQQVLHRASAR